MTRITTGLTVEQWTSVFDLAAAQAPTLNVGDLAAHAGYSPFHFSRVFSAHVGIGPGQYLTALRIDAAKRLLLSDRDPVIDIATAVGFDSLSSFSRRFRSAVGITPGQLRHLADVIGDRQPRPFMVPAPGPGTATVRLEIPIPFAPRGEALIWVGWFPLPVPIGLPHAGALVSGATRVRLPLCEGAPYLLGFAVAAQADPLEQLVPAAPVVAAHPHPITGACEVTLRFGPQGAARRVPLLAALPSLCPP
ncbi:helix-turn-helix transcriptional regulator [Kocuria sp. cx-455]|uniref:helix-turn-helix transcriptional regulator n=1 Tax=Kocuria sp. cx-455 TaxID=2771377 RepID=UPI003D71CBED